ncbi:MAG TPA: HYR domain-containing protein [Blastocatellia bacterium]|nr:HYR domain-containing protein [Blastocatellia bacterium]
MLAAALLAGSALVVAPTVFLSSGPTPQAKGGAGVRQAPIAGPRPVVGQAVGFAVSPPLRDLVLETKVSRQDLIEKGVPEKEMDDVRINPKNEAEIKRVVNSKDGTSRTFDPVAQRDPKKVQQPNIPAPATSFDGLNSEGNVPIFGGHVLPPDPNGAVGPNHYVQTINSQFQIFSKTGTALTPGASLGSIWASISGACANSNDGDPIVLYDWQADRWMISQFCTVANPNNHQLIAISKTPDPTGQYYLYDFMMPNIKFNDYPHFGAWPDAYYMSDNQFDQAGTVFLGAGAFAFDRKKLIAGDATATYVYFDIQAIDANAGGMLPTNLTGFVPPPVGTPNTFWEFRADEFGDPLDAMRPYEFHVDFATPANSTFQVKPDIALAAFDARQVPSRNAVEQPSPGVALDAIADRMMNLVQYRVLSGGVQSYVMNFTVNVSGVNPTTAGTLQTGIRWVELRRSGSTYSVNQQGTHNNPTISGSTGENFWMGSVAQDNQGNIGLAYSRSSTTVFPSLSYTGRLVGDPAGQMSQGNNDIVVGTGAQRSTSGRWGDYSALTVDPADECTFWYTNEYNTAASQALSTASWLTRIGSFKVNAACTPSPRGTISGTVTACSGGTPIANAVVTTPDGFIATTNASGQYTITAGPGTYTVNITAPSSTTCTTNNVIVTNGGNSIVNCCLGGAPILVSAGATLVSESCTPANGVLDPNETVTVSLCVQNNGTAATTNLVGTLQATGGVTSPSGPQNYGVINPGGTTCKNFTFTVNPALLCGGTVTASLQLQDGATDLGTVTYTFTTGVAGSPVTVSYTGPTVPIPDSSAAGVNITVPVSGITGGIADIDFRIDGTSCTANAGDPNAGVDHSWVGDLVFTLKSPAGTSVILINRAGGGTFGSSGNNFCQTLLDDDGAFPSIQTIASTGAPPSGPPYTGTFTPANALSAFDGQDPNGNWVLNVSDNAAGDTGNVRKFSLVITPRTCATSCAVTCTLTCPANITTSNDPNQCGAVVNYSAPTTTGSCGTVTCSPASGSFFPKGTTTVSCSSTAGPNCSFTVTVNDTQPPTITCPANVTAVTPVVGGGSTVVTYPPPTASDNCPGVTAACVPPSGSVFPVGTSSVTCTATDASGNTATCSFSVTIFNASLQDESLGCNSTLLFNTATGDYRFCCGGTVFTGKGTVKQIGSVYTLTHNPVDRRVLATIDGGTKKGNASLQSPAGTTRCTIRDDNVTNNTCLCGGTGGGGGGAVVTPGK